MGEGRSDSERRLRKWARELPELTFASDDLEQLRDQLGFIDASCARYDEGYRSESKRLALAVRVLARDNDQGRGLLSRLGITDLLPWADGTIPGGARTVRLAKEAGTAPVGSLLTVIPHLTAPTWQPAFTQVALGSHRVGFTYWWKVPRIFDSRGTEASRSQIVLWLAHHDGGAHVDDLPDDYEAIARGSSVGTYFSRVGGSGRSARDDSPIPAAMRQIAEEVRFTLRGALDERMPADEADSPGRRRSGIIDDALASLEVPRTA
ncbi:hypothetical protein [Orlajensenia leifsoniae]|uniref:Uncharacterized protein n=1 Tax=Orlajensenia leifsoniae TaxID=2561933 RepID=A0A4Y9QWA9_9MICO|nr:hypothetical protein [Leifsonia flava]TFV95413.1 hypothetical protein E4M00_15325 [Leifsonia flava]